jgi:hypothetical protein
MQPQRSSPGAPPRLPGRGVATPGALPRLRGRRGRHPWERCLACEAVGSPLERRLACEAERVATPGALPRLRGRGEQGKNCDICPVQSAICVTTFRLSRKSAASRCTCSNAQLCSPRRRKRGNAPTKCPQLPDARPPCQGFGIPITFSLPKPLAPSPGPPTLAPPHQQLRRQRSGSCNGNRSDTPAGNKGYIRRDAG